MTLYSGDPNARLDYMNQLAMSAALEDRTLQAVKLNERTGQTMTQPTDMRTLEEKFADSTLLRTRVRSDLLTITDATNTNAIMSSLGPAELRYVAQHFEELAKVIRPKYKMGILEVDFMQVLQQFIAQDAIAPVAGRPVNADDLAQAMANAPNRAQMNDLIRGNDARRENAPPDYIGPFPEARQEAWPEAPKTHITPIKTTRRPAKPVRLLANVQDDAKALSIPTHYFKSEGNIKAYTKADLEKAIAETQAQIKANASAEEKDVFSPAYEPAPEKRTIFSGHPESGYFSPTGQRLVRPAPKTGEGVRKHRMQGRGVHRTPLGRYTIDARSLGDNIVKIRSQKGAVVARYPTEKVSPKLGTLLRKMVSGGSINFSDIEDLDNSEKRYLHKVAVGCELTDKCPISAPRDDAVAIEMDLFTKLRGEIVSGNNNPELIKQLKQLLYKMKIDGSLPGAQVNRVMLDLLSLGH